MTRLVNTYTPGVDRNNFTGYVGYSFEPTSNITVQQLGLRMATGNTGNHTVLLVDNTGATLASCSIDLTGGTVGTFYYGPASAALTSGATYILVAPVTSGGQNWSDVGNTTLNGANVVLSRFGTNLAGLSAATIDQQFVGLDLDDSPGFSAAGAILFTGFAPTWSGGDLSIDPASGHITFTGLVPGEVTTTPIAAGAITFTGFAPTAHDFSSPGAGAILFTGLVPNVGMISNPGSGLMHLAGFAPTPVSLSTSPPMFSIII